MTKRKIDNEIERGRKGKRGKEREESCGEA
jgi:hypothetical protein